MVSNGSSRHFRGGCELSAATFPRLLAHPFVPGRLVPTREYDSVLALG